MKPFFKVKLKVEEQWAVEWDGTEGLFNQLVEFDQLNLRLFFRKGILVVLNDREILTAYRGNVLVFGKSHEGEPDRIEVLPQKAVSSGYTWSPFERKYERISEA